MQTLSQDRIAQLAYQLWQERGCPAGSPEVDWEQAVRMLESSPAPGNEVLSVPEATRQASGEQPAPDDDTPPDATPSNGAATGNSGTLRSRGKGRTLRRSAI